MISGKDMIIATIVAVLIFLCITIFLSGCSTQASIQKDEPIACFEARYMAREKFNSDTLCVECASSIKRDWCLKVLKESPEVFKDFNDCWRTGK